MVRVDNIDPKACPCGGRFRWREVLKDQEAARARLEQLGMLSEPPPLARARSPTFEAEPLPDWD